jgi:hypothetical protein
MELLYNLFVCTVINSMMIKQLYRLHEAKLQTYYTLRTMQEIIMACFKEIFQLLAGRNGDKHGKPVRTAGLKAEIQDKSFQIR